MPDALKSLKEYALIDLQFARMDLELDGSREAVARALRHADDARAYLASLLAQMTNEAEDEDEDERIDVA
ncbi:nitrogen fixation/metabolism regulation signal transduction histidine kinase [Rhodoblastus sphagnicola]|uniref:hypothetical protein n=1 Tax=Rhodoblastus sphagnicola TaxID=333368 RepID=UPI0011B00755|nr:hypothetical protein [Rhodoblastus sphagnicola]MBB4200887.1 nitrogen fixation/metabolism regulation signal transduction histidine kinase [Rhodoblastus sphagnicola]